MYKLLAEATALLALDRGQRQKLPDQLFESFLNSIQAYATKTREQPSSHEILEKLNQIHHLTKSSLAEDITLIKNAVNHAWKIVLERASPQRGLSSLFAELSLFWTFESLGHGSICLQ